MNFERWLEPVAQKWRELRAGFGYRSPFFSEDESPQAYLARLREKYPSAQQQAAIDVAWWLAQAGSNASLWQQNQERLVSLESQPIYAASSQAQVGLRYDLAAAAAQACLRVTRIIVPTLPEVARLRHHREILNARDGLGRVAARLNPEWHELGAGLFYAHENAYLECSPGETVAEAPILTQFFPVVEMPSFVAEEISRAAEADFWTHFSQASGDVILT